MATLAKQAVTPGGLHPTYAACTGGGDLVTPGPGTVLHVKNASGGSLTVTVTDQGSVAPAGASAFVGDLVIAIPAGEDRMINVSDEGRFGRAADGKAVITYSGVTTLTIAALQV